MAERKYQITLMDSHTVDGETEQNSSTLFGKLGYHAGKYIIEYDEQDGDFSGCKTRVHVTEPDCVTVCRTGVTTTELTMEKNVRHVCQYDTPYGTMMLGIYATDVHSDMSTFGGTLSLSYEIDGNGELISQNQLQIIVKEIF